MRAYCASCHKVVEAKKLRGKAICCGAWNSLTKLPKVREKKERLKSADLYRRFKEDNENGNALEQSIGADYIVDLIESYSLTGENR